MKRNLFVIITLLFLMAACVDDYNDANPPHQLDAPAVIIATSASTNVLTQAVPTSPFQSKYEAYLNYGTSAQIQVSVLRAPGKVGSISVVPSIPDFGSVTVNEASVAALIGKDKGDFSFTFTPNASLPDTKDRALNLVITVTDQQIDPKTGESAALTTTFTVATTITTGCFSSGIETAAYRVTAASGNFDGGATYTLEDLEADNGGPVLVTMTEVRPGYYRADEVTGGIWPIYYSTRANPKVGIDLCGSTISGREGTLVVGGIRKFTVSGTLNSDGTISIQWSYVRTSGSTPSNPAKGTYTLTKF